MLFFPQRTDFIQLMLKSQISEEDAKTATKGEISWNLGEISSVADVI